MRNARAYFNPNSSPGDLTLFARSLPTYVQELVADPKHRKSMPCGFMLVVLDGGALDEPTAGVVPS